MLTKLLPRIARLAELSAAHNVTLRWTFVMALVRSRMAQFVVLLPLLALSVHVLDRLRGMTELAPGHELVASLENRMAISMVGALVILVGLGLSLRCPAQIRTTQSKGDYIRTVMESGDLDELEKAYDLILATVAATPSWKGFRRVPPGVLQEGLNSLENPSERFKLFYGTSNRAVALPILAMHYELLDASRTISAAATTVTLVIGGLVALLPTAVLIVQVVLTAEVG